MGALAGRASSFRRVPAHLMRRAGSEALAAGLSDGRETVGGISMGKLAAWTMRRRRSARVRGGGEVDGGVGEERAEGEVGVTMGAMLADVEVGCWASGIRIGAGVMLGVGSPVGLAGANDTDRP